jgi:heme/copper-type cytochrome/quinol oxidase subunit 2
MKDEGGRMKHPPHPSSFCLHPLCEPAEQTTVKKLLRLGLPILMVLLFSAPVLAADSGTGWGQWWLPPNHSVHGGQIDTLFVWIFWITMVAFVAVEIVLVVFLIKYRHRPEKKKAVFTHGNTRLEMAWTLAPAVILAVLALASKKVWDNFRYADSSRDEGRAQVLVIGQQFKWNVIYPGPDGKLGRYLMWPRPTDERWQNPDGSGKPFEFPDRSGAKGPADLPPDRVIAAIKSYIETHNPLGKDFNDPDGKDDSWTKEAGTRELVLPKDRPIEVQLSSKDVIHDFFLPNFRVKLDAVPGMRGHIYFTAMMTSKEREASTRQTYKIDDLVKASKDPSNNDLTLIVNADGPGVKSYKPRRGAAYPAYVDKDNQLVARDQTLITPELAAQLKDAGVTEVMAYKPGIWELVCEELCGANHYTMRNVVRIVDSAEYDALKLDKPYQKPLPLASVSPAAVTAR